MVGPESNVTSISLYHSISIYVYNYTYTSGYSGLNFVGIWIHDDTWV